MYYLPNELAVSQLKKVNMNYINIGKLKIITTV